MRSDFSVHDLSHRCTVSDCARGGAKRRAERALNALRRFRSAVNHVYVPRPFRSESKQYEY